MPRRGGLGAGLAGSERVQLQKKKQELPSPRSTSS
ncbi:hypothetical protein BVI434_160011 [Burkholderia vietnamiensis]|nr:hypothetical protein BVI434_160011 [Burkholderia vietnamiensis]